MIGQLLGMNGPVDCYLCLRPVYIQPRLTPLLFDGPPQVPITPPLCNRCLVAHGGRTEDEVHGLMLQQAARRP